MKIKSSYLISIVGIFLILFVGFVVRRHYVGAKPQITTVVPKAPTVGKFYRVVNEPVNIRAQILENREQIQGVNAVAKNKVPEFCKVQWQRLLSLETKVWYSSVQEDQTEDWQNCLQFIPGGAGTKSMVETFCRKKEGKVENENLCLAGVIMYRALLVDLSTKNDKDFSKMNLNLLLNKFTGRLMQGEEVYSKSIEDMRQMAQEIIKLEPNNSSSYKFPGIVEMLSDNFDNVGNWAKQGLVYNPQDQVLLDMLYLGEGLNDLSSLQARVQANPKDDLAAYHWAGHLWREGQLNESRTILNQLVTDHPENERYKTTASNAAKTNNPKERVFAITLPLIQENW